MTGTSPFADEGRDPEWCLETANDDPLREGSRRSRFALSNGFLGVTGTPSVARLHDAVLPSRTLVAGLFERGKTPDDVPRLVPAPDWLGLTLTLNGATVMGDSADPGRRTTLALRRGLLTSRGRICEADAVLESHEVRFVSMRRRSIGAQRFQVTVTKGHTLIELEAGLGPADGRLISDRAEPGLRLWRTRCSARRLVMAAATTVSVNGETLASTQAEDGRTVWRLGAKPGQTITFQRLVSLQRDQTGAPDAGSAARADLEAAIRTGWTALLDEHESDWAGRWASCDIEIDGDPAAQRALRFAAFHLNGSANPGDEHVSIAARALTGDDYGGHVFWDTDIFLLPFYSLTWPEAGRALLMYRFHTLDGARDKAERLGWKGALYAWESADTGEDVTPSHAVAPDRSVLDILCGTQEQHVSADVAYAVWHYWTVSGDAAFMRDAGAEILLETARFWVSRGAFEGDGRRHIRGVIGPDEYHESVDDNAFTNGMARWNIERGVEVVGIMKQAWPDRWAVLAARLHLDEDEIGTWPRAARELATGIDPETGLVEQFEGYSALEVIDLAGYSGRSVPMDVVLGRARTARSQVIKQADVVALIALLPGAIPEGADRLNFAHYERRCAHGSSLSTAMHGLVAARLGFCAKALGYFRRTAAIDLDDTKAAIAGGVHMAAQGGLWMMTILGFAGVTFARDGIGLRPQLPPEWKGLRFPLQWHGRRLRVAIETVTSLVLVRLEKGDAMAVHVGAERHWLMPGRTLVISMTSSIADSESRLDSTGRA